MYEIKTRIFDICLSFIGLVLLIPIFAVIGLVIKITSKGPVLYRQKRIGKNGEVFNIYKFRTMHLETPDVSTDRLVDLQLYVTGPGQWLRKTSMDELPQLINILYGDMSFVGPRPALYNQFELIQMREEMNVNKLMPGLTGYAQIRGRDLISDFEKVSCDSYYARNQSFLMDLKILCWTVKCVIKAEGVRVDFE